jgi:hypothetical protein
MLSVLSRCIDAIPCLPAKMTTTHHLLKSKVAALCDYLDTQYAGNIETATAREMPVAVVAALIVEHLVPIKQLIEDCEDIRDIVDEEKHGTFFYSCAALAGKDARVKRFLLFFCDLLDTTAGPK